jgi:hypothetical protein
MRRNNRTTQQKTSFNVQAYVDVRELAAVASYLAGCGVLKSAQYGELVHHCIDHMLDCIEAGDPEHLERFEFLTDAIDWLRENGFSMSQFKPVNGGPGWNKRLITSVAEESLERDFGMERGSRATKGDIGKKHAIEMAAQQIAAMPQKYVSAEEKQKNLDGARPVFEAVMRGEMGSSYSPPPHWREAFLTLTRERDEAQAAKAVPSQTQSAEAFDLLSQQHDRDREYKEESEPEPSGYVEPAPETTMTIKKTGDDGYVSDETLSIAELNQRRAAADAEEREQMKQAFEAITKNAPTLVEN